MQFYWWELELDRATRFLINSTFSTIPRTMDGSGGFEVIYTHRHSQTAVVVDYRPHVYARVPHANKELESSVIARWKAALASNPSLFNARKFRFAGLNRTDDGVTLFLGLTDYATFVGTHGVTKPLEIFGRESMALPLGNATITTTSDGQVAMLRRSAAVGEGVGRAGFPGGHPEPDEVIDNDVKAELWNAARREVIEELFLTENQTPPISAMKCLGFIARAIDGKVCQIFALQVDANADQIKAQYAVGRKKDEESDALLFKEQQEMANVYKAASMEGLKLMPDHLGALHLWLESQRGET